MDLDMFKEGQYFNNFLPNSYSEDLDGIQHLYSDDLFELNPVVDRIQVNGDLALIPSSTYDGYTSKNDYHQMPNSYGELDLLDETYLKNRYHQVMKDWKQFVDVEPHCGNDASAEDPIASDIPCTSNFDLRQYLHDSPEKPKRKAPGAGVKRIDLKARRYIVDGNGEEEDPDEESEDSDEDNEEELDEDAEEVDVVTISENDGNPLKLLKDEAESHGTSPALEAEDMKTLLEQFEAAEIPDMDSVEQDLKTLTKAPIQFLHNILENNVIETKPETVKVKEEPIDIVDHELNIKIEPVDSGFSNVYSPVNIKVEPVKVKKEKCDAKTSKRKLKLNTDIVKKECVDVKSECVKENSLPPSVQIKKEKDEEVRIKQENSCPSKRATPPYKQKENTTSKECLIKKEYPIKKECPIKKEHPIKKECPIKNEIPRVKQISSTTSTPHETKHKQIRDSLPQELIDRIKESRKRKTISVIDPIMPNKKQKMSHKTHEQNNKTNKYDASKHTNSSKGVNTFEVAGQNTKLNKISPSSSIQPDIKPDLVQLKINSQVNTVNLDHNYALQSEAYYKCHKKDSGFESAEEEEDQQVIGTQPLIKNADGRMMVSLLKVNTIRTDQVKKRKLNLEEYKKRREGVLKSQNSSQNSSPVSSTCSSPAPEDESVRLKKQQEKLMRMAMEVLNTPAKSEDKKPTVSVTAVAVPPKVVVPPNIEKKTLVSIGVNTILKQKNNMDPLGPIEQLEQVKPLLKQASDKINSNSLITSLIGNILKIIGNCTVTETEINEIDKSVEHGEDKTIIYLPKDRAQYKTADCAVQTNLSIIQIEEQIVKLLSSSTSGTSGSNKESPSSSNRSNSNYTKDSPSSSSSSNRDSPSSSSSYNRVSLSSSSSNSNRERCKRRRNSSEHSDYSSRSSSSVSSPRYSSGSSYSSRSRSRSRSPTYTNRCSSNYSASNARSQSRKIRNQERLQEVEERRVIYVGGLLSATTREELRRQFQRFGPITNVSLHSRDQGDNYGFVTFANKSDAYEAFEAGRIDPSLQRYEISFGGRRIFCQTLYADLDYMPDEMNGYSSQRAPEESFDALLREVQEQMRKRRV